MKKALILLLVLPALAVGCHADHTFMVFTLHDIVGLSAIILTAIVVGGVFLYAAIADWLNNRKRRKNQNRRE